MELFHLSIRQIVSFILIAENIDDAENLTLSNIFFLKSSENPNSLSFPNEFFPNEFQYCYLPNVRYIFL